jgi:hypothetical protein
MNAIAWSAVYPQAATHMFRISELYVDAFQRTKHIRATYNTREGYLAALAREPELRELRAIERAYRVACHYAYPDGRGISIRA